MTAIFVLDNDGQRLSAKYFSPLFTNNADKVRMRMKRGGREGGRGVTGEVEEGVMLMALAERGGVGLACVLQIDVEGLKA